VAGTGAAVVPLTVKGFAAQSADLFQIQNSAALIFGAWTAAGVLEQRWFATDAVGQTIVFKKARGTQASPTIVASGDVLGNLDFAGIKDATTYVTASRITGEVDGTPGSGTDMPGRLVFWTCPDGSATLAEQLRIDNAGTKQLASAAAVGNPTLQSLRSKDLTETTATTICTVSVASGAYTGFSVEYTVVASDATDHQALNGRIMVNAINKAGTVTLDFADSQAPAICSAGTLTPVTVTAAASGDNVIVQITATSSLAQTVLKAYYLVVLTGPGTATPGA
jgi:hypothetical protein